MAEASAGFVLDRDMAMACSQSNVATVAGKATELSSLIGMLERQIAVIPLLALASQIIDTGLLAAKAVKAMADAFMDMAATMSGQGGMLKDAYGAGTSLASGLTKAALGQQGAAADIAKGVLGGVGASAKSIGKTAPGLELQEHWADCMSGFGQGITYTFVDAMNNDGAAVLANARNSASSCTAAAVMDGVTKLTGNGKMGGRMAAAVNVANTLYTYNAELSKAVDEWAADRDAAVDMDAQQRMLTRQLTGMRDRLMELNGHLAACTDMTRRTA